MNKPADVDAYISGFPAETAALLKQLRAAIKDAAPGAEEIISYGMPAYKLNGILVYFAGYARHIGFYPTGSAILAFKEALSGYKGAKGSVQFPLDKPLPIALITDMVQFKVAENLQKVKPKKSK